jgi:hypothetical protein
VSPGPRSRQEFMTTMTRGRRGLTLGGERTGALAVRARRVTTRKAAHPVIPVAAQQ